MVPYAGVFFVTEDFEAAPAIVPLPTLYDLVPEPGMLVFYRVDLAALGGCVLQLWRGISRVDPPCAGERLGRGRLDWPGRRGRGRN